MCVCVCVCACVRACVRACVPCVRACVCVCVGGGIYRELTEVIVKTSLILYTLRVNLSYHAK